MLTSPARGDGTYAETGAANEGRHACDMFSTVNCIVNSVNVAGLRYANIVDYLIGDISEELLTEREKAVAKKLEDDPKFKNAVQGSFGCHRRHATKELSRLEDKLEQLELKRRLVERKVDEHPERWEEIWTARKSNIVGHFLRTMAEQGQIPPEEHV